MGLDLQGTYIHKFCHAWVLIYIAFGTDVSSFSPSLPSRVQLGRLGSLRRILIDCKAWMELSAKIPSQEGPGLGLISDVCHKFRMREWRHCMFPMAGQSHL